MAEGVQNFNEIRLQVLLRAENYLIGRLPMSLYRLRGL
jgi:hypothetical protein